MKKRSIAIILCVSLVLVFAGCTVTAHYVQTGGQRYDATSASDVRLFSSKSLNVPYEVIGSVTVDVVGDSRTAKQALQSKAASLGANAVIDVKLTKLNTYVTRTGLSGVAVRIE